MEVRALSVRLLMLVLALLASHVQNSNAAFRIVPNRLQIFQYERLTFHCEGLDGSSRLRGIRSTERFLSECNDTGTPAMSCSLQKAYQADSSEYWCETEGGDRSSSVSITVAAGSVILDSPVLPVTEGDCVTLRCRSQKTSFDVAADFYKDGLLVGSSSAGEMVLHSVSGSDEGLYKCSISSVGESPQSWLAVRALQSSADHSTRIYLLLRTVFTIVMVVLLLLLVGLIHFGKLRVSQK
ncbi:high affinity immunoglobulin gamma Fc receptor I-like [Stegastes partitus]|uniref:high affinity immunoglobulin gamma Fc receptor I-like n=1 Tax=Stegastes partitus TaxID=144197 RepID=UPI000495B0D3|nr:PREDICTED: high affinity immunoglobulin gamma Fc receptor I-like [Stegastes partitus]